MQTSAVKDNLEESCIITNERNSSGNSVNVDQDGPGSEENSDGNDGSTTEMKAMRVVDRTMLTQAVTAVAV
jgi:hypothetical protein